MMTLKRFKTLTGSYGAALARWPAELRKDAQTLLGISAEARQSFAEAQALDDAIAVDIGDQSEALARLRFAVATRLAAPAERRTLRDRLTAIVGVAASGGMAIAAGLLIGWIYAPAANHNGPLGLMQPAPIELLAD